MTKKRLIIIVTILIVIVIGGYILNSKRSQVLVKEVSVQRKIIEKTVSASGVIKSKKDADLAFPLTGKITKLNVQKDDKVTKGAIVAQIYSYSLLQDVQAAKDARDIALRNKELFLEQHTSDEDDYEINLRKLNEQTSQAQAVYNSKSGLVANSYIKAPFNGTVIDIFNEEGEIATAGKTVLKIAQINKTFFEIELDQEDLGRVQVGQDVEIILDAYENYKFTGKISRLPNYSNTDDTFTIEISVDPDKNHPILLGMTGDAEIIIEQSKEEIASLFFDEIFTDKENKKYIWILQDGKTKKKYIETGFEGNLYTQIKTDLSGVTIIMPTANSKVEIKEGLKAKIVQE